MVIIYICLGFFLLVQSMWIVLVLEEPKRKKKIDKYAEFVKKCKELGIPVR